MAFNASTVLLGGARSSSLCALLEATCLVVGRAKGLAVMDYRAIHYYSPLPNIRAETKGLFSPGIVFAKGYEFLLVSVGEGFGVGFRWVGEGGFPVEKKGQGSGWGGWGWGRDQQRNWQVNARALWKLPLIKLPFTYSLHISTVAIKKNHRCRAGQLGVYRPVSQGFPVLYCRKTDRNVHFGRDTC